MLVLAAVCGYLLGMLSPATVIARRLGADLRTTGSGNPGAANAGRALGRRVGVYVALLDVCKGLAPAALFTIHSRTAGLVAGFFAILGHVSSPLLRGRGGKGVATAFGAILGSHPLWAPAVLVTWVVMVLVRRSVALASVVAAVVPLVAAAVWSDGWTDRVWAALVGLVVVVRHESNLRRWWRRRVSTPGEGRPQAAGSA